LHSIWTDYQQNVSSRLGLTIKVEDEISQRKDWNKAVNMIFQSLIAALIITVLTVLGGIIIAHLGL